MDLVKDAIKLIPENYRKPLLLIVGGALVSTWALAKFDQRVKELIQPLEKKHDQEIKSINTQLKSIDGKLDIVIEKL